MQLVPDISCVHSPSVKSPRISALDKRGKEAQPLPCIDDFTPEELLEMLKESEREIRAGEWYSVDGAVRAMRKKIREAAKNG